MNYYGVRGTANNWFSSYLENRTQFLSINGYSSNLHFICCVVPQRSTWGPLLNLHRWSALCNKTVQGPSFCR